MINTRLRIIAFAFLLSLVSFSQTSKSHKIDSLKKIVESASAHDTVKLNAIIKICYDLTGDDPDMVYKFGARGLEIAKKMI
ncbi:MAG: hypothetical protein IPJ32_11365 [Sphingobacteriaceae bacterium]|nr:hypothetical protein [Sphingobacteriaceae bacterium]